MLYNIIYIIYYYHVVICIIYYILLLCYELHLATHCPNYFLTTASHIMCHVKPAFTEKLGHTLPHFQSRDISPMPQVCFCSYPFPATLRCALPFKHAANLPPKITNDATVVGAAQQGSASSGFFYVYGPGLLLHTNT